jgi:hypothetical protein
MAAKPRQRKGSGQRMKTLIFAGALALVVGGSAGTQLVAQQQGRGQAAPSVPAAGSARSLALVDLTGYWVSVVTEDWRFRMVTPPKGDFASVPLNGEGRQVANTWDPSKDGACDAYGAAAVMRMPGRLHITWEDDNTLKIEIDAGQQTRLLRFGGSRPSVGERTLQGYSAAEWLRAGGGQLGGFGGFGGNVAAPEGGGRGAPAAASAPPAGASAGRGAAPSGRGGAPPRWAPLKVVTTQLRAGWLRKNGVPYSENTTMTEHFIRFSDDESEWFTVVTSIEDPTYLNQTFITSSNFKREADGSKWKPSSCRAN